MTPELRRLREKVSAASGRLVKLKRATVNEQRGLSKESDQSMRGEERVPPAEIGTSGSPGRIIDFWAESKSCVPYLVVMIPAADILGRTASSSMGG
jgi:hypothetical protein